jgi:hypothetical protein
MCNNKYSELREKSTKAEVKWWREKDLNLRTPKRADLQSAAIDHSAIPP